MLCYFTYIHIYIYIYLCMYVYRSMDAVTDVSMKILIYACGNIRRYPSRYLWTYSWMCPCICPSICAMPHPDIYPSVYAWIYRWIYPWSCSPAAIQSWGQMCSLHGLYQVFKHPVHIYIYIYIIYIWKSIWAYWEFVMYSNNCLLNLQKKTHTYWT